MNNSSNIFDQLVEFLVRSIFKILKFLIVSYLVLTAILFVGYFLLDSLGMINQNTGLIALPPRNSTGMPPTADPNRYPLHRESGLLVYFYSEGTKTETIPGSSVCWGSKVNDSYNTIQSFSTDTTVTVVNGGCTFHSLSEVRRLITKAYPSTNWVIKVDNEVIPAS